jgi:thiosulfate/3-mercaptopyruvate sulfurtransferase
MAYTTLISTEELTAHLDDPAWAVIDCRFQLKDAEFGRRAYERSHISGAVYAHLDRDLSGPILPGKTGRHPLPDVETLAEKLSAWGVDAGVQVVAYDALGGALAAARLWWLLRWLGHTPVAVLDGGWPAWHREGRPVHSGVETRPRREFRPIVRPELVLEAQDVQPLLGRADFRLLDARTADRFRGENETLDPVAGHIPGARSAPYPDNLGPDSRFKSPQELQARYRALLGDLPADQAVAYCGSGVTAAHTILAMLHAGLGEARLYAGSWSDWILDPGRPVVTGVA